MRRLVVVMVVASVVAFGCAAGPEPSTPAHGDALAAVEKPSLEACQVRLRAEQLAAERIRKELRVEAIRADPATIKAVAADPAASTAALGIPLNEGEADALQASGIGLDASSAMSFWVNVGSPDRFGGIWIDPPGSGHYVVAVVGGDPDMLALARCFEGPDVRYVWANLSLAEGQARADRIAQDMDALRSIGITVNSIDYQETEGTVVVGVGNPTPDLERQLSERYGQPLRLEKQGPAVPL